MAPTIMLELERQSPPRRPLSLSSSRASEVADVYDAGGRRQLFADADQDDLSPARGFVMSFLAGLALWSCILFVSFLVYKVLVG